MKKKSAAVKIESDVPRRDEFPHRQQVFYTAVMSVIRSATKLTSDEIHAVKASIGRHGTDDGGGDQADYLAEEIVDAVIQRKPS